MLIRQRSGFYWCNEKFNFFRLRKAVDNGVLRNFSAENDFLICLHGN